MDREMRRKEKAMTGEECMEVLETAEYGILSTVSADGTPYGVPMNFAAVNGALYFHCAPAGHRMDNILHNEAVCFNAVDSVLLMPEKFNTQFRSVTVFGKVTVAEKEEEKRQGLVAIIKKLSPQHMEAGLEYIDSALAKVTVLRLDISKMTGKATRP